MQNNLHNLSSSSSSATTPTNTPQKPLNSLTSPISPNSHHPFGQINHSQILSQSSNDSWTNNWQSANPLVMNNHLPAPQAAINNNNSSALDDLDPFNNKSLKKDTNASANLYTLQKSTVNYIYPPGYNSSASSVPLASATGHGMSMNSMAPPNNLMAMNAKIPPLTPQQTDTSAKDPANLNTLSQQDILNFLN